MYILCMYMHTMGIYVYVEEREREGGMRRGRKRERERGCKTGGRILMKANFSMNYSSIIQDNSEREDVYEDARIGVYADVCILY